MSYEPDPRIKPYLDHLEREGPGIPYVSSSHCTLYDCCRQHGSHVINALLDQHWKLLKEKEHASSESNPT